MSWFLSVLKEMILQCYYSIWHMHCLYNSSTGGIHDAVYFQPDKLLTSYTSPSHHILTPPLPTASLFPATLED